MSEGLTERLASVGMGRLPESPIHGTLTDARADLRRAD
jgi:hypothetical protein